MSEPAGSPPLDPQTVQRWFAIIAGELIWTPEGMPLAPESSVGPAAAGGWLVRRQSIRGRSYIALPGGFLVRENRVRFCAAFGSWALPTRGEPQR